jgi:uncharacterized membrane protein
VTQQPGPEVRIGDAEREAAVTALGEHFASGRLTKEEYDERAGQAWAARTASALWPLFADLPRPQGTRSAGSAGAGKASSYDTGRRGDHRVGHPAAHGGWLRAAMLPVLLVLVGLFVLTHLPVILIAVVLVVVWTRVTGHHHRQWRHHAHYRGWQGGWQCGWDDRRDDREGGWDRR